MQVQRITTWPELVELEVEWNTLAAGMPLRSWDWLATWWHYYGCPGAGASASAAYPGRELYVLAIYQEPSFIHGGPVRELIGIAPWYLERSSLKGDAIRWLGDGDVCTDHPSLICRSHDTQQVVAAVASTLTEQFDDWDRLELAACDVDNDLIQSLLAALVNRNCVPKGEIADSVWVLDLPLTWEDYLATVSKSHRKQLRQLQHRVLESPRAQWHYVESASQFETGWRILVDLHQRRRKSLGEPGCFASRRFHDFHREVARRLLGRGQLRLSWLELDGAPIAAEYHVADQTTTYAYQGGVDPERLGEEPGRLSTIQSLRMAMREQHVRLDFLRGDEPYKAHWRAMPHAVMNYRIVPNRRLARLRGRAITLADTLGDWARNTAQLVRPGG